MQLLLMLLFVSYLFGNIALINSLDANYIFWYGVFLFLSVYALTDLLDRNVSAIVWECIRGGAGLFILYNQNDWFGAATYLPSAKYILATYFIISILITAWFVMKHAKEDVKMAAVV